MSFVNRILVYLIFVMAGLALAGSVCAPGRVELNEAEFPMEEAQAATSLATMVNRKAIVRAPTKLLIGVNCDRVSHEPQRFKPHISGRFSLPNGLNAPLRC